MPASKGICAVVPFKGLVNAKQRLEGFLTAAQREQLVAAMLEDTLLALLAARQLDRVLLVSDDSFAVQLARRLRIDTQAEPAHEPGLNAALQAVGDELARQGFASMLVVHGDLPLLGAAEIEQLIDRHRALAARSKISLVPDRKRDGSNCLMCSPPNVLRFRYGPGSCEKHLAIAAQGGIQSELIKLVGASLDIDKPLDLQQLAASPLLRAAQSTRKVVNQSSFPRHNLRNESPN